MAAAIVQETVLRTSPMPVLGSRLHVSRHRESGGGSPATRSGVQMDTNTLLIIVVLILIFGGGGLFYRGRR
jgi:hypothetical protein